MTGREAIDNIHTHLWERHAPGLDRVRAPLRALGSLYLSGDIRRAVEDLEI